MAASGGYGHRVAATIPATVDPLPAMDPHCRSVAAARIGLTTIGLTSTSFCHVLSPFWIQCTCAEFNQHGVRFASSSYGSAEMPLPSPPAVQLDTAITQFLFEGLDRIPLDGRVLFAVVGLGPLMSVGTPFRTRLTHKMPFGVSRSPVTSGGPVAPWVLDFDDFTNGCHPCPFSLSSSLNAGTCPE